MSETTEHPTLSEFLLERIAEDEATIAWTPVEIWPSRPRVLAECEAKRRVVEMFERAKEEEAAEPEEALWVAYREERTALQRALEALALVYADHADYREEWRP